MDMTNKKLIEKAQRKVKRLQKLRQDTRYLKTIGKLRREGFLDVRDVPEYRGQVFLQDALWAAELEPRIYELLPAIIARRPTFFTFMKLPDDLDRVVKEIKAGRPVTPYQDIAPEKYNRWVSFVGGEKRTKIMRSFRMDAEDLEILEKYSKKASVSQVEILHRALRGYVKNLNGVD